MKNLVKKVSDWYNNLDTNTKYKIRIVNTSLAIVIAFFTIIGIMYIAN